MNFKITNIGAGPALKVDMCAESNPTPEMYYRARDIAPGIAIRGRETADFNVELTDIERERWFVVRYEDVFGHQYKLHCMFWKRNDPTIAIRQYTTGPLKTGIDPVQRPIDEC